MPDPLTSLLLVLALAAGLGAAISVAQNVQATHADFYRYYLTHILLFNLLILAGLVYAHLQPRTPLHPAAVPLALVLMAAVKLGWLFAFTAASRCLAGKAVSARYRREAMRIGVALLLSYGFLSWLAVLQSIPALLDAAVLLLETVVLGGALLAATCLAPEIRRTPAGRRRNSLLAYALFHAGLLLLVLAFLLAGALGLTAGGGNRMRINGAFLLLFNVFPPLWLLRYRPSPDAPGTGPFEHFGVTPREKEIVRLIQAGKTNQEIADTLFISLATVKDHNNNLFRKCGVRNRVELANLFR